MVYLPCFLLFVCILFVTFIYFLISAEERDRLREFYRQVRIYAGKKQMGFLEETFSVYRNFYEFGVAICDKIAVWKNQIQYKDLQIANIDILNKELRSGLKGSILLVSHYENIEVARALSNSFSKLKIVILVYRKNSSAFLDMMSKVSQNKLPILYIDDFDFNGILELEKVVEEGGHIGIMGDRVALFNDKNIILDFLGKKCCFPMGAYMIAGILKTRINVLWCERIQGKYHIELEQISKNEVFKDGVVRLGKNRIEAIKPLIQKYVKSLEVRVIMYPQLWFNFYDYWNQDVKTKI